MAQCMNAFGASSWLLHLLHILTYHRNTFCSEQGESTHNSVNTSPVSSRYISSVSVLEMEAYHSKCLNFHNFKWRYYSVAIRLASAEFGVAVIMVG